MTSPSILLVLLVIAFHSLFATAEVYFKKGAPHVKLSNGGLLTGIVKFSRDGRPFHSFTGIPYATIPERFQESQLITDPSWPGVKSATKKGPICTQMQTFSTSEDHLGEEDCLNLNVYVPMNNTAITKKGLAVMVWVHGGGFVYGDGVTIYDPRFLMDEDVIVVTINYRLGVFGFLSTGDSVIPGNNGLKDMVNALKWVQENIQKFGGNQNSITIFGESAGGAAVHYLYLSPTTKGLIHRAIAQSGSVLNGWAWKAPETAKQTAVELATYMKCPTSAVQVSEITSQEILECLKGISAEELCKAQVKFKQGWPRNLQTFFFVPTTEPTDPVSDITPFLSEPPISIFSRNDNSLAEIPLIMGSTEDEGALMFSCVILNNPELLKDINADWETVAPIAFDYGKFLGKEEQKQVSQKLKQFYFGDKEIGDATKQELTNLYSDAMFLYGIYKSAFETASRGKQNPVYLYQYAYKGPISVMASFFDVTGECTEMVGHGDELQHIFDFAHFPGAEEVMKPDSPDEEFSKNLVRLWTSFAIHGEPKHTWGSATFKKWKYITKKELGGVYPLRWFRIETNPVSYDIDQGVKDRMQLWESLWNDHFTPAIMSNYMPSATTTQEITTEIPDKTEL